MIYLALLQEELVPVMFLYYKNTEYCKPLSHMRRDVTYDLCNASRRTRFSSFEAVL